MACNQLNMVRNQFRTRGYEVDDIESDGGDRWAFTILNDPEGDAVGVAVAFIASADNPCGDRWVPANIHWGTNVTTYSGTVEQSPADLADTIVAAIAADNSN
jgi:hypothetical protein